MPPRSQLFHAIVVMGAALSAPGCVKHHVVEVDVGTDSGTDAGTDAGPDTGPDMGRPDAGPCADDCDLCFDDRPECVGCEPFPCIL